MAFAAGRAPAHLKPLQVFYYRKILNPSDALVSQNGRRLAFFAKLPGQTSPVWTPQIPTKSTSTES
jgi:hypothetical protein